MKNSKKKLSLKKKTVFNLNDQEMDNVKGGGAWETLFCGPGLTGGCSDGCSLSWVACPTEWNCTRETCTNDCGIGIN